MQALRTPDARFANLPGYNFEPHYAQIDNLRMHYVDAGPTGCEKAWQDRAPGAQGQPHTKIKNAGHFLQEDKPDELVEVLIAFVNA